MVVFPYSRSRTRLRIRATSFLTSLSASLRASILCFGRYTSTPSNEVLARDRLCSRETLSFRKASRMSRRTRLRRTAGRLRAETANPTCNVGCREACRRIWKRNRFPSTRRPVRKTRSKDVRPRRIWLFLNYRSSLTVNLCRPRARRRATTFRPFFVAIRARNPCVFFRLRLCG